jgi:hypothetical protein
MRMTTAFHDPVFMHHVREVEGMVDRGVAFDEVERRVAETHLREDDQAALWLLAWSDLADDGHYRHRRIARQVPLV